MLQDVESKLLKLTEQINKIKNSTNESDRLICDNLEKAFNDLLNESFKNLTPIDRVYLARHPKRPNISKYIDYLFTDFIELKGDRLSREDESILAGIGLFNNLAVTIIGNRKGTNLEENIKYNFGMSTPAGYRKVQRLAKQAEKFKRPIITFIDTPGAYPGIDAEKTGQGEAIASCLAMFSDIKVPVIAVIIGEGGSGGALAIGLANSVIMLENSVYSILSPEGFATILWKDAKRRDEAANIMKLTAQDLLELEVVDHVISEGIGSIILNEKEVMIKLESLLKSELNYLLELTEEELIEKRYQKYRTIGKVETLT